MYPPLAARGTRPRRPSRSYEAHLPAQEAQARPHPRLPRPHAHARRPARAEAPPRPRAASGSRPRRWPIARAASAAGCRAAASSIASTARVARTPAGTSSSTRSRAPTTRPTRGSASPSAASSAAPSSATASSGCCARRSGPTPASSHRGHDFVIVARPPPASWRARAASRRSSRRCAPCSPRPASRAGRERRVSALRGARSSRRCASTSARSRPACRRAASTIRRCSEYAVQAVRRYGVLRGVVLAAWRLLRCNPWSHGGVDFVEDQTLFRARDRADLDHVIANILQPLIDACQWVLEFWHDLIGDFGLVGLVDHPADVHGPAR